MSTPCPHLVAVRQRDAGSGELVDSWACESCNATFYPREQMENLAASYDDSLDAVAQTTAAVLWELHERAVVKYGEQVASAVTDTPPDVAPGETCAQEGHVWAEGVCTRCGQSAFLGGQ